MFKKLVIVLLAGDVSKNSLNTRKTLRNHMAMKRKLVGRFYFKTRLKVQV